MEQRTMMGIVIAAIAIFVIMMSYNISKNNDTTADAVDMGDAVYETLDDLNDSCSSFVGVPDDATDIVYSSSSDGKKATARVDFTYEGYTCWYQQKITLYSKNFTDTTITATSTSKYTTHDTYKWKLQWNDTEGLAMRYDGSNGWMMCIIYVTGDNVTEEVMQAVVDGCYVDVDALVEEYTEEAEAAEE